MKNRIDLPLNRHSFFTILIPVHNEEENISDTVSAIVSEFKNESIMDFDILIINDHSTDNTEKILKHLHIDYSKYGIDINYLNNQNKQGFGRALRFGLSQFKGECVAIVMGDLSDNPKDMVSYYRHLKDGVDCVFGSRFIKGSCVIDYPKHKLILNRIVNTVIKMMFLQKFNDTTNAFKAYHRRVIEGCRPLVSCQFNLTVELPLKAIVRSYNYKVIPISWQNRKHGKSKLLLQEMGSRYLFSILYVWLEKLLTKKDY